jgi:hypothetical protein
MNSNYLKSIRIVYFALAMGIVLLLLATLIINNANGPLSEEILSPTERAPFLIVLIVLTGAAFILYRSVFPKKLEAIKNLALDKKLLAWRELSILQGALIEAPAFFALVLFMLLGIYTLFVWPVAAIALFWLRQPTRDRLIIETNLTTDEIAEFDAMQ